MKLKHALVGSLAAAVGAFGLATATANADPETWPQDPKANQPGFWEDYFDVEGIKCTKTDREFKKFTLGEPGEGLEWYAVILKAGAGEQANEVFRPVEAGDVFEHSTGKEISHVITCTVPVSDDEPDPTEEPTEPGKPDPTEEPTEPGKPDPTDEPTEPGKPDPTDEPTEPGKPDPEKPGKPDPEKPGKPAPEKPGKPGTQRPGLPSTGV